MLIYCLLAGSSTQCCVIYPSSSTGGRSMQRAGRTVSCQVQGGPLIEPMCTVSTSTMHSTPASRTYSRTLLQHLSQQCGPRTHRLARRGSRAHGELLEVEVRCDRCGVHVRVLHASSSFTRSATCVHHVSFEQGVDGRQAIACGPSMLAVTP